MTRGSLRQPIRPVLESRRDGWIARWHGGAYIEIFCAGYSDPLTVINVYDYAKGEPTIPFTRPALALQLRKWLERDEEGWREADDIIEHQLPYL